MQKKSIIGYGSFILVLLGVLSAFGPFVTDMYLPALPQLQTFYTTDASTVQLSLSASMLGLALGQIFIGPVSDKYGRKPLVIISLLIFILSTLACLWAPSIHVFVALRFIQGIGGAGGIVLSRSVATDRYWGEKLAKMMAIIGAINGIAPVVAPVAGGMMTDSIGWRGIFTALLAIGVLLLIASCFMKESLAAEKRSDEGLIRTFASFRKILSNPRFVNIWLQYGFCGGTFFAYISSSPFVIQQYYGFSAFAYSVIFGFNAILIGLGSAVSVKFRTPMHSTLSGAVGILISALCECFVMLADGPFWAYEIFAASFLTCIGLCFTSSTVIALNEEHDNAGAASALVGAVMFAFGCIVTPLVGLGTITHSSGFAFVGCGIMSLIFCLRAKRINH